MVVVAEKSRSAAAVSLSEFAGRVAGLLRLYFYILEWRQIVIFERQPKNVYKISLKAEIILYKYNCVVVIHQNEDRLLVNKLGGNINFIKSQFIHNNYKIIFYHVNKFMHKIIDVDALILS